MELGAVGGNSTETSIDSKWKKKEYTNKII